MIFYYIILLAINIVAIVVFRNNVNITAISILPVVLLVLSIFQAIYLHNNRRKKDFNTNNNSPLTEKEWECMTVYMRNAFIICIPLYLPFIFFFDWWTKIISLLIYFIGFTGGTIYYRIKHGNELKARFSKEDEEIKKQKENEELGKWK